MVWYALLFQNFPQFIVIHTVQGFGIVNEAESAIKIARRNINNLRSADDTTLMAENEELKSLLMKVEKKSEHLA